MGKVDIKDQVKLVALEILPGVFHVTCDNKFDLAMTFMRSQEYYESDNPKVRGKEFGLLEYIRWYSRSRGLDSFTYPKDWAGFNVPSSVIKKALDSVNMQDWNMYDSAMENLVDSIPAKKFYLIGTMRKNDEIVRILQHKHSNELHHEIAHALYYLDGTYKEACRDLVATIPADVKNSIYAGLKGYGYAKRVWDDEIQAYMVSGIKNLTDCQVETIQGKFSKLFKATCDSFK